MTDLSPAAQAVLDAYWETFNAPLEGANWPLASTLRALADQVLEDWNEETYDKILAIATELEGHG
jgi:hypothetical protein